jgi:murein L,D-transpeptidase YcbB/YkuD
VLQFRTGAFVNYASRLFLLPLFLVAACGSDTPDLSPAELRAAAGESGVGAFYEANGWHAVWSKEAERALRQALKGRAAHGLDRVAFLPEEEGSKAEREAALTRAALTYASALARGFVDPGKQYEIYTVPRPEPDLAAGLAEAIGAGRVGEWLAGLAPRDAEYRALSGAYLRLRSAAEGDETTAIPDGDLILGPANRARAAAVAMERRRWLTRRPPPTRIDVNIGTAMLSYFRDGALIDRRRVVVGQPDWQTPELQSQFFRLVANPTWTVPKSIEADEMANAGASYFRRNNMVRRDGWIVQLPGPENSLGLVKFDLDNEYAIYLHDTPAKALFEENLRHLSHGCIRVSDALGFARMIAADQGLSGQWERARASRGEDLFLRLPEPFPVRLLYHPTWLDPASGEIRFAPDVYGRNGPIGEQLGFGEDRGGSTVPHVRDVGP